MSNYLREQIDRKKREIELQKQASNIYTIHPKKSDLILLYEVLDGNGETEWGGENAEHCIQWLSLAPSNSRVLVSAWDSDEEDAHLVGQTIDITAIVRAASL
jgi:hypothetical protein